MRNVMIVDDESLVRLGLQSIIDWESCGYRICGVFKNAEEALEAAGRHHFDVALTDIRMPGMDGFELIRQLKRVQPHTQVVVLSSYNDFDYTRRAIQLGVKDYISKYELEPEELIRVLNGLDLSEVESRGADREGKEGQAAEGAGGRKADGTGDLQAEKELVLRLTRQQAETDGQDIPVLLERLRAIAASSGEVRGLHWISLKAHPREQGYLPSEHKAMTVLVHEIFVRLKHMEFLGWDQDAIHGLVGIRNDEEPANTSATLERIAEELIHAVGEQLNIPLIVGVSSDYSSIQTQSLRLPDMRTGAQAAMGRAYFHGPGLYFEVASPDCRTFSEKERLDYYALVKHHLQLHRFGELEQWVEDMTASFGESVRPVDWSRLGGMIASQLEDLVIEAYHAQADTIERRFGSLWPFAEAVDKAASLKQLRLLLQTIIRKTSDMMSPHSIGAGWVQKIKDYVELHYANPVRLEDAALLVNFSENYFSQRFRQETGEAFSDYLTRIRIREAIRLFRETELSTEEIACRVGYTNPNYFIKVFKKTTGKTISGFKQHRE